MERGDDVVSESLQAKGDRANFSHIGPSSEYFSYIGPCASCKHSSSRLETLDDVQDDVKSQFQCQEPVI